ncbi:MAG: hypothetical protein LBB52_09235 [Desulfovibrio sp.]|nr:hypothetical protein [Desulfovibrio sp.]
MPGVHDFAIDTEFAIDKSTLQPDDPEKSESIMTNCLQEIALFIIIKYIIILMCYCTGTIMAKARKTRFVLRIASFDDSKKLLPDTIRAKDLADVITKIDSALSALVKSEFGQDFGGISILRIGRGSLTIENTGPPMYMTAVEIFGKSIEEDSTPPNAKQLRNIINDLEKFNSVHDTKIEFKRDKKSYPFATIKQALPPVVPLENEISGETTIYGKITGITGTERIRITLKLISGDSVDFNIPPSTAKEFGKRYNEIIGVSGNAKWNTLSGSITAFEMKQIVEVDCAQSPTKESFSLLREKFSEVFDEIHDVNDFVSSQRND